MAATMALMPTAGLYVLVLILVGGFGLGYASVTASTSAYVADLSGASTHGAALGTLSSIMDIGHSTGPMVGGLLVAALGFGRGFAYMGVVLALIALGYAWFVSGRHVGARRRVSAEAVKE